MSANDNNDWVGALLALGIGAIALYALSRYLEQNNNQRPDEYPCPYCGRTIRKFARTCPHCRRVLIGF